MRCPLQPDSEIKNELFAGKASCYSPKSFPRSHLICLKRSWRTLASPWHWLYDIYNHGADPIYGPRIPMVVQVPFLSFVNFFSEMFARKNILSLVIPFLVSQAVGEIQLDISNQSRLWVLNCIADG
jgi:hypothetical protein